LARATAKEREREARDMARIASMYILPAPLTFSLTWMARALNPDDEDPALETRSASCETESE
jgi:hypothetical protein